MNRRPPEQQLLEQLTDGVRCLPLRQKVLLLRLVRRIQEDPKREQWAWALCLDSKGGNGK